MKVTFKNTKTKKSTAKKFRCVVKPAKEQVAETTVAKISSVKQVSFSEFTVTMSQALDTVKATDFKMVRDSDNQDIQIKSATLDTTDKTKVKLIVHTPLKDAKTYTVTYTASDEAKTQSTGQITVSDGEVASVAITPLEITVNKATTIYYRTLDANGVIVSENKTNAASRESAVSVSYTTLLGTYNEDDATLTLFNEGDTCNFTVTYHTYKYDENGKEETIEDTFTVKGVKDSTVISAYSYTVATEEPFDWSKVTERQYVSISDTIDGKGTDVRTAYFHILNNKGADVTKTCGYSVESANNSIVVADGNVAMGAVLAPVAEGSTSLIIKDETGAVVYTFPITVKAARKLTVFKPDTTSVNLATDAKVGTVGAKYVTLTAKDQYGEDLPVTIEDKTVKSATYGASISDDTIDNFNNDNSRRIGIETTSAKTNKTSVLTIRATDENKNTMDTTVRVVAKDTSNAKNDDYTLVFLDENGEVTTTVDTTVIESNISGLYGKNTYQKTLTAYVAKTNSGVIVSESAVAVTTSAITVKNSKAQTIVEIVSKTGVSKNGTPATKQAITTCAAFAEASNSAIVQSLVGTNGEITSNFTLTVATDTALSGGAKAGIKNLSTGKYTVQYTVTIKGTEYHPYNTLEVTDSQTSVSTEVATTTVPSAYESDFEQFIYSINGFDIYYGNKLTTDWAYVKANYTINGNTNPKGINVFVSSIVINVQAGNNTNDVQVTVPINKTFTKSSGDAWTDTDF